MKKLIYIFLMGIFVFSACRNDELDPRPSIEDNIGAVTLIQVDPDNNFFNFLNPEFSSEAVIFEIDVDGFDVTKVESVDMQLQYIEKDGTVDEEGKPADSVYAPVDLGTVTSFPSTVTITAQQVADALNKSASDFEVGDQFITTFPINTADGRRLTVALSSDLCNQPAQPSAGGCSVQWSVACPSELGGPVNWEILSSSVAAIVGSTGSMDWTNEGGGKYEWDTYTFGGYQALYGCCEQTSASPLHVTDVCETIAMAPFDAFGCAWEINSIDELTDTTLTLTVFGQCLGYYQVQFTRTDNKSWPAGLSL